MAVSLKNIFDPVKHKTYTPLGLIKYIKVVLKNLGNIYVYIVKNDSRSSHSGAYLAISLYTIQDKLWLYRLKKDYHIKDLDKYIVGSFVLNIGFYKYVNLCINKVLVLKRNYSKEQEINYVYDSELRLEASVDLDDCLLEYLNTNNELENNIRNFGYIFFKKTMNSYILKKMDNHELLLNL